MTSATRIFLAVSAVVWLPYGVFCFLSPGYLQQAAGIAATTTTAAVELRAMYGGLQTAIGLLTLLAALRASLVRPALTMLAFLCAGLALGRFGGIALDGDLSSYTLFAVSFETLSTVIALVLLNRTTIDTTA
jgi:hypothetical protein